MKTHTTLRIAGPVWLCALGIPVALSPLLAGCESTPSQATENQGEVPEGYASWEAYWADQDQQQKDLERDKARYRMQLQRQHSGALRR